MPKLNKTIKKSIKGFNKANFVSFMHDLRLWMPYILLICANVGIGTSNILILYHNQYYLMDAAVVLWIAISILTFAYLGYTLWNQMKKEKEETLAAQSTLSISDFPDSLIEASTGLPQVQPNTKQTP